MIPAPRANVMTLALVMPCSWYLPVGAHSSPLRTMKKLVLQGGEHR